MRKQREPQFYAVLRKRYSTPELWALGFVRDGSAMVKPGGCRRVLAEASSLDGVSWRVRPHDRHWKGGLS